VPSARYVDDLYIFYPDRAEAQKGLVELSRMLRKDGLHLNERKSKILPVAELVHEETELDRMFEEARQELQDLGWLAAEYGFIVAWGEDGDPEIAEVDLSELLGPDGAGDDDDEAGSLAAVELLYERVDADDSPIERIERFCLPILGTAGSTVALERALNGLRERPHLSQQYASYIRRVGRGEPEVTSRLEAVLRDIPLPYSWQRMWILGALTYLDEVSPRTVQLALQIAGDHSFSVGVRAIAVQLAAKHGNVAQRRAVRHLYEREPSEYVRSSILFASRYFPTAERKNCMRAWGGHGKVNPLIVKAVKETAV
jgi:hypothetical protein